MAYKINTAVVGFGIGHFINTSTGAAVTTGTPTCKRTLDGTGGACANAASYNTNGAVWEIDLDAADMNGTNIILSFTLTDCIPISYTLKTETKLVSELNDAITAPTATQITADIDANSTQLAAILLDTGTTLENRQVAILEDVTGLNGDVMRGTENANTVIPMLGTLSQTEHDATQSAIAALNNIAATDIVTGGAIATTAGAVDNVTLVDTMTTYTGNTPQTGDSFAIVNGAAGLVAINADVEAILLDTAEIGVAGAGLTEAGGTGDHLTAIDLPNQTMDITGNITGNLSGSVGSVTALAAAAVDSILDEEVDNDGSAISLRGALKLLLSSTTGKISGGGTSTLVFRDIGDSKPRLSITVDANGNRTAVGTRDAT